MKMYKVVPYDLMNDIWLLKERFLWIFWVSTGSGTEDEVTIKMEELNKYGP